MLPPARAIELLGDEPFPSRWLRLAVLAAGLEGAPRVLDLSDQAQGTGEDAEPYEVIWCGSRLSEIEPSARAAFLRQLEPRLTAGGVAVFTVAGVTPEQVCEQFAAAVPDLDLLLYQQDAHGGQDVVACRKRPA